MKVGKRRSCFGKSLLVDSAKDEFSSGLASGVAPNIAIAGESEPAERKGAFTRDELLGGFEGL